MTGATLRVSIVMPSFNHASYIRAAVDSVLAQRHPAVDLLVMDGGSTDGTVDILRSYGDRIRFVSQRDRGQGDAINRGLAQVSGDILTWLNSDDMLLPDAVAKVVAVFEESPHVDFVYGRGWNIDETGTTLEDAGVLPFNLWRLIHQRNFIQQPSCFFRRTLLEKVGPLDEGLHYVMDWDLWIRFAAHDGEYLDEFLSHNRVYDRNKTQSGQFRRWREIRDMVRRYSATRWPPVLALYLIEALIQRMRVRRTGRRLAAPLARLFTFGMAREMSGWYADGGVAPRFRFTVGNPFGKEEIKLTFSPLSRYDRFAYGREAIEIDWRAQDGAARGGFRLLENGVAQQITIRPGPGHERGFVHIACRARSAGQAVGAGGGLPARRIVGFLDRIDR
jgi:glycosyltransferase involved in cell wall biosynthesis